MRKTVTLFLLAILAFPLHAQRSMSADVEVKQVAEGKLSTTRKHVCCTANGRLVSFCTYPKTYYSIEYPKADGQIWIPSSNEVYTDKTGALSSKDNLMYIFLSRAVYDMGLQQFGYTLKSSSTDAEGYLKKTFVTDVADNTPVVELVFKDYLPVYTEYKNIDGRVRGKLYYSSYTTVGRISFPCRTTEILYTSAKDSTVVRTIYTNLSVDSEDSLASFEIPSDAKPVSLSKSKVPRKK